MCRASARVTGRSHPWVLSLRNTSSHTGHVRSHASGPHPNVSLRPGRPCPHKCPPFLPFQVSSIDPETARSEPPFDFGFHREGCPAWEPTPSDSFEIETCVGKPPVSCFDWRGLLRDAERKARTKQGVDEVERTAPEREGSRCVQGEWKGSTLDVDVDLDERGRRDHRQNDDERE